MCDLTGKLTAWLDGELAAEDAAEVERHLQLCPECRSRVEAYRQVSGGFEAYCEAYSDAAMRSEPRVKHFRPALALFGVAAAAVAALFLLWPRAGVRISPVHVPQPPASLEAASQAAAPVQTEQAGPAPIRTISRIKRNKAAAQTVAAEQIRLAASQPRMPAAIGFADEPAVEIAIPADAIFPPGAVPEGLGFTADVTIGPDGSAQQIRVRPQLTEFERRANQP